MITVQIDPILLRFGHWTIGWYGIIVAAAVFAGMWLATREAERKGLGAALDAILPSILVGGLVGARLLHVADHWSHGYSAEPWRILAFWEGGLAIWGAVLGGIIVLAYQTWRRQLPFMRLADAVVPGAVLGQAVGRLACIVTGDSVGLPTSGPFGLAYTSPRAMVPELGIYYTPMPVYEIVANLLILGILWRWRRQDWPDGLMFAAYLGLYALARFGLAFTSAYRILALGMTQSQMVALGVLTAATILVLGLRRRAPETAQK